MKELKIEKLFNGYVGLEIEGGFNSRCNNMELGQAIEDAGCEKDHDFTNTGAYHDDVEFKTEGNEGISTSYLADHITDIEYLASEYDFITDAQSAGLHCNISKKNGFSKRDLANIYYLFYALEDELFNLMPEARSYNRHSGKSYDNSYRTYRVSREFISQIKQELLKWEDSFNLLEFLEIGDALTKCNPLSFHKVRYSSEYQKRVEDLKYFNGPVEFRFLDANMDNLRFNIMLCQRIVDLATSKGQTTYKMLKMVKKIKKRGTLKYLLLRLRFSQNDIKYIENQLNKNI